MKLKLTIRRYRMNLGTHFGPPWTWELVDLDSGRRLYYGQAQTQPRALRRGWDTGAAVQRFDATVDYLRTIPAGGLRIS